jgi:integrase
MPQYLEKRRRRWYAVLDIPEDARKAFGKKRLVKSLETDSLAQAQIRVLGVVQEWKEQIEAVRHSGRDPSKIGIDPSPWRSEMTKLKLKGVADWEIDYALRDIAEDITEDTGDDDAYSSYMVATGKSVLLSEHMESYLDDTVTDPKSRDMKIRHLSLFLKTFKLAEDVTQEAVAEWVEDVLTAKDGGVSYKTAKTYLSTYRTFWRYLGKKKLIPRSVEAFTDVLEAPMKSSNGNGHLRRSYFEPEDYKKLLKAAHSYGREDNDHLADLIRLAAHTGCRIDELCGLDLKNVILSHSVPHFIIGDAKTEAGNRKVPIHSGIKQLVSRLMDSSEDGYLLSGLTFNKYGSRSNAIGKRFGRLKTSLDYGPDLVFHSFRRGVATQFENKGVPEVIAARILGHEFPTMSFGTYSGGADLKTLSEAVETLNWT